MARTKGSGGRTTSATSKAESGSTPASPTVPQTGLPPLRKRKPAVFWFVILATAAMAFTTFAGFFQALR